jgi:hypothetical protein
MSDELRRLLDAVELSAYAHQAAAGGSGADCLKTGEAVTASRAAVVAHFAKMEAQLRDYERAVDEVMQERDHREEQIERIYAALGGTDEWSSLHDLGDDALMLAESAARSPLAPTPEPR